MAGRRVPLALAGLLADAAASSELTESPMPGAPPLDDGLAAQAVLADLISLDVAVCRRTRWCGAVIAWTQLFGMLSFKLFGQFVGSFEPADALFARRSGSWRRWRGCLPAQRPARGRAGRRR